MDCSSRTRKCGNLLGSSSTGNEKLLCTNNSLAQFNVAGPIPSFDAFGSLSNSSSDLPGNHSMAKRLSPVMALTPSSRLPSPQRMQRSPPLLPPPSPPLPRQQPQSTSNVTCTPSSPAKPNVNVTNEQSHPTKGSLQHYDPALYNQLKSSQPFPASRNVALPPLIIPRDRAGNRLAIIRGSGRRHSHKEVKDIGSAAAGMGMAKMHAFYKFLREIYPALEGCQYLLPGLQQRQQRQQRQQWQEDDKGELLLEGSCPEETAIDGCTMNVSKFGSFKLGHVPGMTIAEKSKLTKPELAVAKRRIECAIYAFGGFVIRRPSKQPQSDKQSIFRTRNDSSSPLSTSTQLPIKVPSQNGDSTNNKKNKQQQLARSNSMARRDNYEKKLALQYFEHGNRLSWDVQANLCLTLNGARTFDEDEGEGITGPPKQIGSQQRRKNRCKKCGQIKEGHTCPYQSSLLRSIGVMVYPSANAHVADEPGRLAPALCEMNNFISIRSSASFGSTVPTNEMDKKQKTATKTLDANKTSEKVKDFTVNSINEVNPFRRTSILAVPTVVCGVIDDKRSDEEEGREDKAQDQYFPPSLLFQPKMEITIDQYRTFTPRRTSSASSSRRDYTYPQVPLTFSQRKSMSDTLFSLSRLVPKLTEECAIVLTEARRRDQWDLAVAELMTQVICVLHCGPSKDYLLGGLRQYLMGLGIVS